MDGPKSQIGKGFDLGATFETEVKLHQRTMSYGGLVCETLT